jgi:hypothetical protein
MNKKAKGIMVLAVVAIFGIITLSLAGCGGGYHHMTGPYGRGPGWQPRGGYSGNFSDNTDYYGSNYGISRYGGYGSMAGNGPGFNGYCLP